MGKYGRTPDGADFVVKRVKPGDNPAAEIREAERMKVDLSIALGEEAIGAMRVGDYDTAIERAQLMCTAIVHAGNAAQIAERYFPLPSPSESEVKP